MLINHFVFIDDLVGGFGTFFIVPYIGNVIILTDFHIFQRGRLNHQPVILEVHVPVTLW